MPLPRLFVTARATGMEIAQEILCWLDPKDIVDFLNNDPSTNTTQAPVPIRQTVLL